MEKVKFWQTFFCVIYKKKRGMKIPALKNNRKIKK